MPSELDTIRRTAAGHGFTIVGVTSSEVLREALEALEAWSGAGYAADMRYMTRNPPERADARTLLGTVRSIVTVAVDYGISAPTFEAAGRYGRVARFAWGLDYHDVVIPRLEALGAVLSERLGRPGRVRVACDHSPLLERAAAARAGLGFFGKNTCLLRPRHGSWTLLGEILLPFDLPVTHRSGTDHCGTCRECLAACPTAAFPEPYVLDARRCISYLTIESRGPLPRTLRARIGPWVFGCDVCQEVCPFNRFAPGVGWPELAPEAGVGVRLDLARTLALATDEAFRARFGGTPLLRTRRAGLLRNAAVVARNIRAEAAVPALVERVEHDTEGLIRGHALWALFGLAPAQARELAERLRTSDPDPLVRAEAEAGLAEDGGSS